MAYLAQLAFSSQNVRFRHLFLLVCIKTTTAIVSALYKKKESANYAMSFFMPKTYYFLHEKSEKVENSHFSHFSHCNFFSSFRSRASPASSRFSGISRIA